jgi:D-alanine-D-alanine ligase
MRVAVVRNCSFAGIINLFGRPCSEIAAEDTAQITAEALRDQGHTVMVCEGDKDLLPLLEQFMPTRNGHPTGMVFNLARGIQGECARSHVPAMLEMAGFPYTSASPVGHALTLDRAVARALLRQAGIPTPNHCIMRRPGDQSDRLAFPLVVKPRFAQADFGGRIVRSHRHLAEAIDEVVATCEQEALVEEYVDSIPVSAALLGNDHQIEFLPLTQHGAGGEASVITAASLGEDLALRIRASALATFQICRCQDYARIDFRIDVEGTPQVVGIESMPPLDRDGSYVFAAAAAAYDQATLVQRILDAAHSRYFGVPSPRFDAPSEDEVLKRDAETEHP